MKNIAFIDGQNLSKSLEWNIDYKRFAIYLKDKYKIEEIYYFLGYKGDEVDLYENLQKAGFIIIFNPQGENLKTNKKGNVDTNLVFHAMKKYAEKDFDKLLLVSGDGDFFNMVQYLVEKEKFLKIIFPNLKNASSLYKQLSAKYYFHIYRLKEKLEYKKRKGRLKH